MWGKKTRNAADFLRYLSKTGLHCFLLATALSDSQGDCKEYFQVVCDHVEINEKDRTVEFLSADKWGLVTFCDVTRIKVKVANGVPNMVEIEYLADENVAPDRFNHVFVFVLPAEMRTKGGPIHEATKV